MRPTQRAIWLNNIYINALQYRATQDRSFIINIKEIVSYLLKQFLSHSQVRDASGCMRSEMEREKISPLLRRGSASQLLTQKPPADVWPQDQEDWRSPLICVPTDTPLQCTHNQTFVLIYTHTHTLQFQKQMINNRSDSEDLTGTSSL